MINVESEFASIFSSLTLSPHQNNGITIVKSLNNIHGFKIAKTILEKHLHNNSVLYLSGGKTPKEFYAELAEEEQITPGAVALIDERYGPKWHENSNELMIKNSGLLRYFDMRGIPTHLILQNEERIKTAEDYDQKIRSLNVQYQKHIGILGIGVDGHTAGIARDHDGFHNPMFDASQKTLLVSEFNDENGPLGQRISMTFTGLSMLDINIIMAFGPEKGDALEKMFSNGTEEDIPARFFKRADIAPRTLLITDQLI